MSANATPALPGPQSTAVEPVSRAYSPAPYGGHEPAPTPEEPAAAQEIARVMSAIRRYKWLVLLVTIVGSVGGVVATRFLVPKYAVGSTILITAGAQTSRGTATDRGPIRDEQTFDPQGWIDLLKSFAISDSVVMRLALYVRPHDAKDTPLFKDFSINRQRFFPGEFTLETDGPRYTLRDRVGMITENGIVGDSVGRSAGFLWRPSKAALGTDRKVKFTVRTPRETSVEVMNRLNVGLAIGSNIIILRLTGRAQDKPAETLNAWGEQFVRIATELKTDRISQFLKILEAQRSEAADRLTAAERALQSFRVQTIALPSEGTGVKPGMNGIELRQDPVLDNYFTQKFDLETIRRDRIALERVAGQVNPSNIPVEGLLAVNAVAADPIGTPLRTSLSQYSGVEAQVKLMRETYTDSAFEMRRPLNELRSLQARIPGEVQQVLTELRRREATLQNTIAQGTRELQGIPARTITEEALRREVMGASTLFTTLEQRFREAELAEKSATPDVRVLDTAVMPLEPTENTVPMIIVGAMAGSLALGLALAVLLDRLDRRFRYPAQAGKELGLQILGVVPVIDQTRRQSPEQIAQIVEAFRSIRMNVRYAAMPGSRVALTITSPGANDGKSLVSSNLALSFAEGGWRTVLIDGDLRRGQLNTTFDLPQTPGLVEYLEGTSLLGEVLYQTNHENLVLLPSGSRHRRGPELLATPRMHELLAALGRDYDAIIVDTPPLGAGTDAYAIGAATGNMAVVLRSAMTDLRMAQAKLRVLDNLPVRVIGAILNEIETEGQYQYYSYDPEYAIIDEPEPAPQLAETSGAR